MTQEKMPMVLLQSFEESNSGKKKRIERWLLKRINCQQQHRPVSFLRETSFYLTTLPDMGKWPLNFKNRVFSVIVDRDMKEDLERKGLINWCSNVRSLVPVHVPRDGNCLLHSVSTAVWGISDKTLMLRRLVGLALSVDQNHHFFRRWTHYRKMQVSHVVHGLLDSPVEGVDREWTEICQCLEPDHSHSAAVPHRFLESVHVYTLANVLRRPIIIITDPTIHTFSGMNVQDNDMGGIYLPLEWSWTDTSRTPVLLGYSQSHFCPLLLADLPVQALHGANHEKYLVPLMNKQLEQIPVRYLFPEEELEVGKLLKKYLKVKETVIQVSQNAQTVLCIELETFHLSDEFNLVDDYFQDCLKRLQQEISLSPVQQYQNKTQVGVGAEAHASQQHSADTFTLTQVNPQHAKEEQLPGIQTKAFSNGDVTLETGKGFGPSQIHIPPPSLSPHKHFVQQNISLNTSLGKRCVVPACQYYGDPELGNMCSSCFTKYTIKESRQIAASRTHGSIPSAPLASMSAKEECFQLSMMSERCKEGCGYRCSRTTYPYCHECAAKHQQQIPQKEMVGAAGHLNAIGSLAESSQVVGSVRTSPSIQPVESTNTVMNKPVSDQNKAYDTSTAELSHLNSAFIKKKVTAPAAVMDDLLVFETSMDDQNTMQLFGNGQQPQSSSGLPGDALLLPGTATSEQTTQKLTSLSNTLAPKQQSMNPVCEQELSSATRKVGGQTVFAVSAGGTARAMCATSGCIDTAVHKNFCGKCYVGQGLNSAEVDQLLQKQELVDINSTMLSSSVDPGAGIPKPPSSNVKLPLQESKHNYVGNWLNESCRSVESPVRQKEALSSGSKNQSPPVGLPETQDNELPGSDLLASGAECQSWTKKCVGCGSVVQQEEKLCQQCQDILQRARHGLGTDVSGKARKLGQETGCTDPAKTADTVPRTQNTSRTISVPPVFNRIYIPLDQQGQRCTGTGCSMFGDPKQAGMCWNHYQQHLSTALKDMHDVPPTNRQNGVISVPFASEVYITPKTVTLQMDRKTALDRTEKVCYGVFPPQQVPISPPSVPFSESQSVRLHGPSLHETYPRVAGPHVRKCLNPSCTNFGNKKNGGLCNGCAQDSRKNNGVNGGLVFGDEETG